MNEDMSPECLLALATAIALEIAKEKDLEDIITIKNLLNQISLSLNTIIFQKGNIKKGKKEDKKKP